MKIADIELGEKPLLLAPMEDVTDPSFRYMCKRFGADVVYTEFISSDGLIRDAAKSLKKLEIDAAERPVGIQLYGHLIEPMVEAARMAEAAGPDIIDINFGCPVKKIAGRGAGSGMMRDVPLMVEMTRRIVEAVKKPGQRLAGACFTSGSAGTMSAGDLLKERYPDMKLGVGEALQCPTILNNGFGGHRIEGIGDKHIPWIHNVKNTDMAIAIDDEDSQRLLRLFNTAEGKKYLKEELKLSDELIEKLTWLGISGIANVLCCIKMAKYYELTEDDVVCTVLTDSAVMYGSRIEELNEKHGAYSEEEARLDHNLHMLGLKTDSMMELTYEDRKRIHNLKYYTWVEQQARDVKDLNALWYDTKGTWDAVHAQAKELDELINEFNEATGLLKAL